MKLQLFTDLYETLKMIVRDIKALTDIPVTERKKYRDVLGETYTMLDTSLMMIVSRLGSILAETNEITKLNEIRLLHYRQDWMDTERKFRLCTNLRITLAEARTTRDKLIGTRSVNNWNTLIRLMEQILASEGELADYIGNEFENISVRANSIMQGSPEFLTQLNELSEMRNELIERRRELIKQESFLYDEVI